MNFTELRQKYTELRYEKFDSNWQAERPEFCFTYTLIAQNGEKITFQHRLSYQLISQGKSLPLTVAAKQQKELENFVFQIGMAETINYWKLACPKRLTVVCGQLTQTDIAFWKKLYYNGLGEFIYLNGIHQLKPAITVENLVEIAADGGPQWKRAETEDYSGTLIPVGGGKDSVVTLELLKDTAEQNLPFVMSPPQAAYDCIEVAGYDRYLLATRTLDGQILKMNAAGYLNGHVPFSAILAFIAALGAALTGKRYIALSNEKSANEPSVPGTTFNHQYSKTLEFEQDFAIYLERNVSQQIKYFSLLRPLYEIEIGRAFAQHSAYHPVFRSCNRGKKTNEWCGGCSKCLFVYIILSPYIEREDLQAIFGKDLLADAGLRSILGELTGMAETKPFECVGTIWEVRFALAETVKKYGYTAADEKTPVLIRDFLAAGLVESKPEENYESGDCLPEEFRSLLNANNLIE